MKLTDKDRILILAPHPDDEVLSSFKIIKEAISVGAKIKVIFVTNGERNYLAHIIDKKKIFITEMDKKNYGLERQIEAKAVMKRLGITDYEFWNYPDSELTQLLYEGDIFRNFNNLLIEFSPTLIISPSLDDIHPDHSAVSCMAQISIDDIPENVKPKILYYTIHSKNRYDPEKFDLFFSLSLEEKKEKSQILSIYKSQSFSLKRVATKLLLHEFFTTSPANAFDSKIKPVFTGGAYSWFKTEVNASFLPVYITAFYFSKDFCKRIRFRLNGKKIEINPHSSDFIKLPVSIRFQKFLLNPGGFFVLPNKSVEGLKLFGVKIKTYPGYFDDSGIVKPMGENKNKKIKVCVIIPCYNISEICGPVVLSASDFADYVIVIDDGSTDNTEEKLEDISSSLKNVKVIRFPKNRGKGTALIKGMRTAIEETDCDLILSMDGDGQHRSEDIPSFIKAFEEGGEFIIGHRNFSGEVPFRSWLGNNIINFFVRLLLNKGLIDSQSGFRGFSRECAESILKSPYVREGRYETEIDILVEVIKGEWRLSQVEIPTIYLDKNKKSSFKPIKDSIRIISTLLRNIIILWFTKKIKLKK